MWRCCEKSSDCAERAPPCLSETANLPQRSLTCSLSIGCRHRAIDASNVGQDQRWAPGHSSRKRLLLKDLFGWEAGIRPPSPEPGRGASAGSHRVSVRADPAVARLRITRERRLALRQAQGHSPWLAMSERVTAGESNGWEAGIRTPITWSRATCPTVERPPTERGVPELRTPSIANPNFRRQAARCGGRRGAAPAAPHWSIVNRKLSRSPGRGRCPVCAGDSPFHPCVQLRGLLRSSTRAQYPFDARPCLPCWQSRAACFDPLTRIRDLLWPLVPPTRTQNHPGQPSYSILGLQPTCHGSA